jgi:SH3 domain-containing protein
VLGALALLVMTEATSIAEQAEISGTANVYLRSGPGADYPTVGVLNAGDRVTIVGTQGVWTRVATADARVGYLNRRFLTPTTESPEETSSTKDTAVAGPAERPSPAPSPAAEARKPELAAEMAALRAEISELKQKIEEQRDQQGSETYPEASTTPIARTPPVAIQTTNDPVTAREQGVGVLAVAMLCLIIGWVLGSTFTRRRSRSQRSRLRF